MFGKRTDWMSETGSGNVAERTQNVGGTGREQEEGATAAWPPPHKGDRAGHREVTRRPAERAQWTEGITMHNGHPGRSPAHRACGPAAQTSTAPFYVCHHTRTVDPHRQ